MGSKLSCLMLRDCLKHVGLSHHSSVCPAHPPLKGLILGGDGTNSGISCGDTSYRILAGSIPIAMPGSGIQVCDDSGGWW